MDILCIILGLLVFTVFIIFVWEMIKSIILETMFSDASIYMQVVGEVNVRIC